MKKIIVLVIIILVVGWYAQNYTSFKAVDYAKYYWQKVDLGFLKNIKLPSLNLSDKSVSDADKQLNIFIRGNKFLPNYNAIKQGSKVTWFNDDDKIHTVTGDNWGSGELKIGQTYSRVFDAPGNYNYHCSIHPSMTGEIIVQ